MKVLWLCNIMLPAIAGQLGLPYSNREGWLTGTYERLVRAENQEFELGICFPAADKKGLPGGEKREHPAGAFKIGAVSCYGFQEDLSAPERYDEGLESELKEILTDFEPDVVHIFGTEFPHARAMVRVFNQPEKILVGIQGLCYRIAEVYTQGLPEAVVRRVTFRDWVRNDSITGQLEKFRLRGRNEQDVIRGAGHITGRTGFDREGTARVNPEAVYHPLNETMRTGFYTGRWDEKACEPESIFLSQGDYPVKGFHYMLQALPRILGKYPNAHLYVAGNNVIGNAAGVAGDSGGRILSGLKERLKVPSYGKYLQSLIRAYHLEKKVTMLGRLDEAAMKERYLKSSVFVCPSVIENSPNAMAEAMLLGVPVVAAGVGGIPDMLTDGKEGLLFPGGDYDALAAAVVKLWDQDLSRTLSKQAAERAAVTHNRDTNYERLTAIYHEINLHF